MTRKNIALERPTHEKLTRFGKKGESYNDITLRLLKDEPYISPLRLALANYVKADEAFKHLQTDNPTLKAAARQKAKSRLGDLIRQIGYFFDHITERSR